MAVLAFPILVMRRPATQDTVQASQSSLMPGATAI